MFRTVIFLIGITLLVNARVEVGKSHQCFFDGNCDEWVMKDRALMDDKLELSFAIVNKNLDKLSQALEDVSNPDSPNYGNYWSYDEVHSLVEDADARAGLIDFLLLNGVTDIEVCPSKNYVFATMYVAHAESLFHTEFYQFTHSSGMQVNRALSYSLPESAANLIEYVEGVSNFPTQFRHGSYVNINDMELMVNTTVEASGHVTPALLNRFYDVDSNTVTNSRATQSVFESLGQYFEQKDIATFCKQTGISVQQISQIIGLNDGSECETDINDCAEASLDVQYILAMAQNSPTTFWSVSASTSFGSWIQTVSAKKNPPLVHSISYGSYEEYVGTTEVNRFNTEAQKLGLRGVTVVASSGDDGVANFQARQSASRCGYHPSWPAASPYIVTVGATKGPESGQTEVGCESDKGGVITTGGGFSVVSPRPSYQSSVVSAYLSKSTASSGYNTNGRGYPDVAVMGYNYPTVIAGQTYLLSGTSASAPVFAGMLTLVNNARLNSGKSSIGFANPALYKIAKNSPRAFNDITSGRNACTANQNICCSQGFSAVPGWDPVGGLGSPNFSTLKNAWLNL